MDVTSATVCLRQDGSLTLPKKLRTEYHLSGGDLLTLVDLGGVFLLTPKASEVSRLATGIEQMREEAGLTVDDLLEGLG